MSDTSREAVEALAENCRISMLIAGPGARQIYSDADATLRALLDERDRLQDMADRADRLLKPESILALPSEHSADEMFLLDNFSLRVGLEDCRKAVRSARAVLQEKPNE